MIEIRQLPLGPLQTNCYLLACQETQAAAVIDPAWDGDTIMRVAADSEWNITHILLTHAHFDHVGGLAAVKAASGAPVYGHPDTHPQLLRAADSAANFGLTMDPPALPDHDLTAEQQLRVGNVAIDVLYTPGHAPGHVTFHLPAHQVAFVGDVLFRGSIGRSDLPGCDHAALMQSLQRVMLAFPDETHVLSGHGPATTIGEERRTNPFLQGF